MLVPVVFFCALILVTGDADFSQKCLDHHNKLRKKHHAPPLVLNDELGTIAQEYANKIAGEDTMKHSYVKGMGENLYMSSGLNIDAARAVQAWYDEIKDYNFDKGKFAMETGHFTQVVWVNTKTLGCAYATSASGATYVVANYKPPGNVRGGYDKNVLPSLAGKIVSSPLIMYFCSLICVFFNKI